MIILVGEIDLSVGSQQAIAGLASVLTYNATGSVFSGRNSGSTLRRRCRRC